MTRDEMIEAMCEAAFNDQGELGWANCREAGNKSLGLVRERMGRALDAIEPVIRAEALGRPDQPCTGAEFLEGMAKAGVTVDPPLCRDCGLFASMCICHEELNGPGGSE